MPQRNLLSILTGIILLSAAAAQAGPLRVFILAGQSNMQGHAQVRTFSVMGLDPETAPLLKEMTQEDGSPRVCDHVWISSLGSADEERTGKLTAGYGASAGGPKIGPEFTFGVTMHKRLGEPILLIKTAWGGKSLNTDFRPPSAGPYEFNESQLESFKKQGKDLAAMQAEKAKATGRYYRLMIEHVKKVLADIPRVYPDYDAKEGYELSGFVWFQGWNDMVDSGTYPQRGNPGGYDAYSEVLAHFIRDVRKDLAAPRLPFVIGVLGIGGPIEKSEARYAPIHREFRQAMAAPAKLPEFEGSVVAVWTEKYWDLELSELRAKDATLQQEVKALKDQGKLSGGDAQAEFEKRRAAAFTERERKILTDGASNAEFHYLGSAKILGRIGQAFAEALPITQQ